MAYHRLKYLLFVFILGASFMQCTTSSDISRASSIQSGLDMDPNLSTFKTLVETIGGMKELLNKSTQKHTFFVPTNEGFDLLGQRLLDNMSLPENKDVLLGVLQSHISEGVYTASTIEKSTQALQSVFDTPIDLSNNSAHILYSVKARDGMIHVIDKVIQR